MEAQDLRCDECINMWGESYRCVLLDKIQAEGRIIYLYSCPCCETLYTFDRVQSCHG